MLKEAFDLAKTNETPSSMVSAAMGLVKLHGLDAETQRKINSESPNERDEVELLKKIADMLPG